MSSLTPNVSPLRQRMIEDMRMRKFNGKTQIHYIRAVRRLAAFSHTAQAAPRSVSRPFLAACELGSRTHFVCRGIATPKHETSACRTIPAPFSSGFAVAPKGQCKLTR
ncbi:hypothetical protein GCM10028813_49010 [Ramlibacter alkalitolerans]